MEDLLEKVAQKYEISADLLRQLIEVERPRVHLEKRRNVGRDLRQVIERWSEKQQ